MEKKDRITVYVMLAVVATIVLWLLMSVSKLQDLQKMTPARDYYSFKDLRVHIDSMYSVQPFNDGYLIMFVYGDTVLYKECYGFDGFTAKEVVESYLLPFENADRGL